MIFFWAWGKKLSSWRENVGQQRGWLSWACGRPGWCLQSACCRNASLCQGFSVSSLSAGGTPCLPSLPSLWGLGLFLCCRLVHRPTGGIQCWTSMCSVQAPVLSLSGRDLVTVRYQGAYVKTDFWLEGCVCARQPWPVLQGIYSFMGPAENVTFLRRCFLMEFFLW